MKEQNLGGGEQKKPVLSGSVSDKALVILRAPGCYVDKGIGSVLLAKEGLI